MTLTSQTLNVSSIKTGCHKLGRIYVQIFQRRLGRVSVVDLILFFQKCFFSMLSSTFVCPVFTPVVDDFNVSSIKTANNL